MRAMFVMTFSIAASAALLCALWAADGRDADSIEDQIEQMLTEARVMLPEARHCSALTCCDPHEIIPRASRRLPIHPRRWLLRRRLGGDSPDDAGGRGLRARLATYFQLVSHCTRPMFTAFSRPQKRNATAAT